MTCMDVVEVLSHSQVFRNENIPRGGRSAQQVYPYRTLLVKRRCALKVHFNNDRYGKGVPIETYLLLYNFLIISCEADVYRRSMRIGVKQVWVRCTTPLTHMDKLHLGGTP